MMDQADKLRSMVSNHNDIKIYSIVSGKGGVGKTNITVNLAIRLQQMGKRVLVLDADIGMSNTNILFGVEAKYSLMNLLQGDLNIQDIIIHGPSGVDLISGGADLLSLESLDKERQESILKSLSELGQYDVLIIDNGAGLSKQSLTFTILADEIILVATPEPTALTDAYRVLKAVSLYQLKNKVKIIINQVQDISSGEEAFNKLLKTSEQFLKIELENVGYVFSDIRVGKAIMAQYPVILKYPNCLASNNISQICSTILGDENYSNNISSIKQFSNRLIKLFG